MFETWTILLIQTIKMIVLAILDIDCLCLFNRL